MSTSASKPAPDMGKDFSTETLGLTRLSALVQAARILNSTLDLDRLLEVILEVATRELDADRGTVYLVDHEAGEIRARISQGLESRILRVKIGEGISGKVAETGETVRIEDAYNDPRFQQRFDTSSGYRTRSMLCMAVRSKTSEIIGVIQLLNKKHGTFVEEDEGFLASLSLHVAVALENAKLHARIVDQQRITTELALARQIQQKLLPRPPERWQQYRISAVSSPCFEVGGDYYDFLEISTNCMGVIIADVSGKGVSSALVVSTMQATMRALVSAERSYESLLARVNEMLRQYTGGSKFVTLFAVFLDSLSNKFYYINAGHNPAIIVRKDGSHELLTEGSMVLGLLPDVRYQRARAEMQPGDLLLLYTDGVAEAFDKQEDMFGIERMVLATNRDRDRSPEAVAERVMEDLRVYTEGTPKGDDQTLIVLTPET